MAALILLSPSSVMVEGMNTHVRILVPAASALALGLVLTGCGQSDDGAADLAPAGSDTSAATTDAPATGDASTAPSDAASPTETANGGGSTVADLTAAGLAAIVSAEAEASGVAFGIDDANDDQTWEVDVRTDAGVTEVRVSADGSEVLGTELDDLDADDAAALDAATITLAEAIEAAVAETGGMLDDAELSDDGGVVHFEVTVDTDERRDVDVDIDAATGAVIGVE